VGVLRMHLYLVYGCPFAHRSSFALQEKRIAFEPRFFQQGKRPPELEDVGANAKSPTLFDGDVRVWDSQIVLEYLEDRYPDRPLLPAAANLRARVRMLESLVAQELGSHLGTIAVETIYKPQPDEAKVAEARRGFIAGLDAWNQRLAGREFLVGDALSLADVTLYTVFPAMEHLAGVHIPVELAPLRAWHDRIASRPSAQLLQPTSGTPAPPS
jgi:glutathione S-transferase